jgi:hypothetical protein
VSTSTAVDRREWFLDSGTKKVGPMTQARVLERLAQGKVPAKTKAWREGMEEWLPVAEVEALAPSPRLAVTAATPAPVKRLVARPARPAPAPRVPFAQAYRIERGDLFRAFEVGFERPRLTLTLVVVGVIAALGLAAGLASLLHWGLGLLVALGAVPSSLVLAALGLGALSYQTRRRLEDAATPGALEALGFAKRHVLALVLAPVLVTLLAFVPPLLLLVKSLLSHVPAIGPPLGGLTFGIDLALSAATFFFALAAGLGWYFIPHIVAFEETGALGTVGALLRLVKTRGARIFLWPTKAWAALAGLGLVLLVAAVVVVAVPVALEYPVLGLSMPATRAPEVRATAPVERVRGEVDREPKAPRGFALPPVELSVGLVGIAGWTLVLLVVVAAVLGSTANALTGVLYVACREGNDDRITRDDHLARRAATEKKGEHEPV